MRYISKHSKPKSRRVKKYILNSITAFMGVLFWLSICALDSESWIPVISALVAVGWMCLFALANDGKKERR